MRAFLLQKENKMIKILAFAGSSRKESFNKKLIKIAAQGAEAAGAKVTLIDLVDYDMPLFNEDLEKEQGMPEKVREFKALLDQHDAFLIASPEYNGAFSPLLKNALDWASRSEGENDSALRVFKGKPVVIMSTSPGQLGGIRGLVFLRMLLANFGMIVLPEQLCIPFASKAFDETGALLDSKQQQGVLNLGITLAKFA